MRKAVQKKRSKVTLESLAGILERIVDDLTGKVDALSENLDNLAGWRRESFWAFIRNLKMFVMK